MPLLHPLSILLIAVNVFRQKDLLWHWYTNKPQCNCHWKRCREGDEKMVSTGTGAALLHFWFSCKDSKQEENTTENALQDPCDAGLAGTITLQCTETQQLPVVLPFLYSAQMQKHVVLHCWCCFNIFVMNCYVQWKPVSIKSLQNSCVEKK